jgi:hypothetical protein
MAHDVFISYASGDKAVADAACATLESKGIRCWIAPRDVLPGIHYGEAIIDAIHECRIMVLVFSAKANLSGHIPKEIERAVSRGTTIMPMRIEDVAPAKSLDYFIGSVHWLDALTPPLEVHLQRLASNVQTLLARDPRVAGQPEERLQPSLVERQVELPSAPIRQTSRPHWTLWIIAGLTLLVIALGIMMWRSNLQPAPTALAPAAATSSAVGAPPAETPAKKTLAAVAQPAKTAAISPAPIIKQPAPVPTVANAPSAAHMPNLALRYIAASTVKLEQLIGQEDKQTHQPTLSRTFQRYQIRGAELGASFDHEGHTYFLFGDTIGRQGRAVSTLATSDALDPEAGVELKFVTVGGQYLTIEPPGIAVGALDVPVGGISLSGHIYVALSTKFSKDHTTERGVLTRFDPPSSFTSVRTISERPAGHFIRITPRVEPAPIAGLPPGGPYVLIWGTGKYREDDAYLSVVPVASFESGKGTRYFAGLNAAGAPSWSDNESDATPILKEGTLGDLSVTWCKDLGLWLMTYDRRLQPNGIAFSYSRTPWGPWSEPQLIFNMIRDGALGKFIHDPHAQPDDGLAGPIFGFRKLNNAEDVRGGAYAPYMVERWAKVQGSELHLYYVISTVNPYVVVLMKSRLAIDR